MVAQQLVWCLEGLTCSAVKKSCAVSAGTVPPLQDQLKPRASCSSTTLGLAYSTDVSATAFEPTCLTVGSSICATARPEALTSAA